MAQIDASKFDPYYKWLAIPPHEQPPNHYRLLGVELFEDDLDVIAAAADRQMAHVKSFAASRYSGHSQRLLNELAGARISLLNPERKAGYDKQLKRELSPHETVKERLSPRSSSKSAQAESTRVIGSSPDIQPIITEPRLSYDRQYRRRKSAFLQSLIRVLFFLLILIPTIIIAWQIDLENLEPQPDVVQRLEPQLGPPKPRPTPPVARPKRQIEGKPDVREPEPHVRLVPIMPVQPQEREEPKIKPERNPGQAVPVTFESKSQRAQITLEGNLRVKRIDGCPHEISPRDGQLSQQVEVTLTGPRPVLLTVSLDDRGQLVIEPTIENDAGKTVPCTVDYFEYLMRSVVRRGKLATGRVGAMQDERDGLQTWVNSPVLKPLASRNAALARIRLLDNEIANGKAAISELQREAQATNELLEWCKAYSGKCTLIIEAMSADVASSAS